MSTFTPTGTGGSLFTLDNEVFSATTFAHIKDVIKDQERLPVGFDKLESTRKKEAGGERIMIRISSGWHSDTTQFTGDGYDDIDHAVRKVLNPGFETWADWVRPAVISGHEERINRGPAKIIDLGKERLENVHLGMRLELIEQIFAGTSSPISDVITLCGDDYSTGLIESASYGSQTNVVHELSKGTFNSGWAWQNQAEDALGAASSNLVTAMYRVITRRRQVKRTNKNLVWYVGLEPAGHLKSFLQANERYLSERDLDGGRRVMAFDGVPVEECGFLPIAGSATASKPWSALLWDHEDIYWTEQSGYWFKQGMWKDRDGMDVRSCYVHCMGQLTGRNLFSSGIVVDAEEW